jgi:hypothetical protein
MSMSQIYSNAVIVRIRNGVVEFLKSALLQPVTQFNPAPTWTPEYAEAEMLSGTEDVLQTLACRYGGVAVVGYGSDRECWMDRSELAAVAS